MSKVSRDALRQKYVDLIKEFLIERGEEVLLVASNEIAIPCVDDEGNDEYCCFTVKVPVGDRDGNAYDAYERAQEYAMKQQEKAEKAARDAERKAAKIARDEDMRRQKAEAKAKREGQ